MTSEWMNLSEAARMLGVHPSTVRSWSDQGHLPTHRTQGGHRRYKRNEIELWIQSRQEEGAGGSYLVMQKALKSIRLQISEGRLASQEWYQKLDEEARAQYRLSGRAMLQGLVGYLTTNEDTAESEARSLGYEYASRGWRYGLGAAEASRAFLFFRNVLVDSMLSLYESAALHSSSSWSEMFRKINSFTDQIQLTLLETYDAYQRGNR